MALSKTDWGVETRTFDFANYSNRCNGWKRNISVQHILEWLNVIIISLDKSLPPKQIDPPLNIFSYSLSLWDRSNRDLCAKRQGAQLLVFISSFLMRPKTQWTFWHWKMLQYIFPPSIFISENCWFKAQTVTKQPHLNRDRHG